MNTVYLILTFCHLITNVYSSYQLIFPSEATTAYAKLNGSIQHSLNSFTICHWVKCTSKIFGTVFSYAVENRPREFLTGVETNNFNRAWLMLEREGVGSGPHQHSNVNTVPGNKTWVHICIIWDGRDAQFYVNGKFVETGSIGTVSAVSPNGIVLLGQDQGAMKMHPEYAKLKKLEGQVSELHLWDFILNLKEIKEEYQCTLLRGGNIINWKTATWILGNGTMVSSSDTVPCGRKI